MSDLLHTATVASPVGHLTLVASRHGLRAITWEPAGVTRVPGDPVLLDAARQLDEYFGGHRMAFDLPLDLRGTPFQLRAWKALADIPYGTTVSYRHQASRLGIASAARAVGAANARNPLPIVLPCHRVVGANGSLTGYGGGLEAKRWLLALETGKAAWTD